MPSRLTLLKLAENLIRESRAPFSAEEFVSRVQERWRRKIAESTLAELKKKLSGHDHLIEINANDYLSCQAVLEKIVSLPLAVALEKLEIENAIFIPGHRLVPFISGGLAEGQLRFLGPDGKEIPRKKKKFALEDVIDFYRYSGDRYFPDQITVNEWMPGKSSVSLNVWDIGELSRALGRRRLGGFKVRLLDYERGEFRIEEYPAGERREDRLRKRALHVALEEVLARLCAEEDFGSLGLEKQLLRAFYHLDETVLNVSSFSLLEFLDSLKNLTAASFEDEGPRFAPAEAPGAAPFAWEPVSQTPTGRNGSLDDILEDIGFPFNAAEFAAILNATLDSERYKTAATLDLLFGGKNDRFVNQRQRNAFYRLLRKLLLKLYYEKKDNESRLVADLREKAVTVKLGLIEILRFLETRDIILADLPAEVLDQIVDLDRFCAEILPKFESRNAPPELKTIRDIRLALKFILPNLARLREDVYCRLGVD
ncbi:MAG: hypothetical protein HZA02_00265 [Nitrospinae bacterium]|nr:hypothetical protein [Nitrospinota bacterium]